ncbi:uncharacterized protein LOC120323331 [Pipra filicauda]|uniref:Uncharacterized protein LOC120323331 n=1 Tax=Pipra filicauda TaxID=649802 RepID=A0A7R5KIY7_9PASS|nr:uncharacterized protein LOC120323331 [Pipra filicauda]
MGPAPSRALPDPPRRASRATQTEWNCPVCHRVSCDSLAVPCGHAFCLGCLLRGTAADPACPRCRSPVIAARFSVLGDADFLQCILSPPGRSPGARRAQFRLVETCPWPRCPRSPPAPAGPTRALPAELWAELLHGQEHLLDPVRPWLRHSLEAIHGPRWWEAREVESIALSALCIYGPDRDALAQILQNYLGEYTAPLVHGLVHVTLSQCGEAWQLHCSQPARDRGGSSVSSSSRSSSPGGTPTASPGGTPTHSPGGTPRPSQADTCDPVGSGPEDQLSTSEAPPGSPSHPPCVPVPAEQEQPQDVAQEPTEAPGPSTPDQDRGHEHRQHRHPRKRRARDRHGSLRPRRRKKRRK